MHSDFLKCWYLSIDEVMETSIEEISVILLKVNMTVFSELYPPIPRQKVCYI